MCSENIKGTMGTAELRSEICQSHFNFVFAFEECM